MPSLEAGAILAATADLAHDDVRSSSSPSTQHRRAVATLGASAGERPWCSMKNSMCPFFLVLPSERASESALGIVVGGAQTARAPVEARCHGGFGPCARYVTPLTLKYENRGNYSSQYTVDSTDNEGTCRVRDVVTGVRVWRSFGFCSPVFRVAGPLSVLGGPQRTHIWTSGPPSAQKLLDPCHPAVRAPLESSLLRGGIPAPTPELRRYIKSAVPDCTAAVPVCCTADVPRLYLGQRRGHEHLMYRDVPLLYRCCTCCTAAVLCSNYAVPSAVPAVPAVPLMYR